MMDEARNPPHQEPKIKGCTPNKNFNKATKQQRAELPKHRPEPDNSEATSSSNGQRRKRLR